MLPPRRVGPRLKNEKVDLRRAKRLVDRRSGPKSVDATWEFLKHLELPRGENFAQGGFAPIRYSVLNSPAWLRGDQPPKSKKPRWMA